MGGGSEQLNVWYPRKVKQRDHMSETRERHCEEGLCELSVNDGAAPIPGPRSREAHLWGLMRELSEPGRNRGSGRGVQSSAAHRLWSG